MKALNDVTLDRVGEESDRQGRRASGTSDARKVSPGHDWNSPHGSANDYAGNSPGILDVASRRTFNE